MAVGKVTIACFGATGGCIGAALAYALKGGHFCTAREHQCWRGSVNAKRSSVIRNHEKLLDLLTKVHDVPEDVVKQQLTIIEGDVMDLTAVSKALINPVADSALVDVILSGVGAYPTFQWSIRCPFPLTDPNICELAIRNIFHALADHSSSPKPGITSLKSVEKPFLIVVSTAGCGRRRGVPLSIYLPYHYLLGSPLADKRRMEELVLGDRGAHVRASIIVRPFFLTDGAARGETGLRVGWEWGVEGEGKDVKEPGPEIGYYVSRKDVGIWIYEKGILQDGWAGKCVYLTY